MDEEWKPVPNSNRYMVSNLGRIARSRIKGLVPLKPSIHGRGYLRADVILDGIRKSCFVHRLVAEAFLPNESKKPHVNHIDGDKRNNRVENLEWVTNQENVEHARKMGLAPYGSRIGISRLTESDIPVIFECAKRMPVKQIAERYGVYKGTISRVLSGKIWSHARQEARNGE